MKNDAPTLLVKPPCIIEGFMDKQEKKIFVACIAYLSFAITFILIMIKGCIEHYTQ